MANNSEKTGKETGLPDLAKASVQLKDKVKELEITILELQAKISI